jgi:hypothetical protein
VIREKEEKGCGEGMPEEQKVAQNNRTQNVNSNIP